MSGGASAEGGVGAYLRLYRVRDWLHFLPLPLAGWAADPTSHGLATLASGVVAWGFGLAYTCAINQAFDDRVDRASAKNPVGSSFQRRAAVRLALPPLALMFVTLALGAPSGLPAAFILAASATLYSAPPRLKRFVFVGTLWNLIVALPGFFFAARPPVLELPLRPLAGAFTVVLLASQLIHEAQDKDDDARAGVRTVATVAGRRAALLGALALVAVLPLVTYLLGSGLETRWLATALCVPFSGLWVAVLNLFGRTEDRRVLKLLRLGYRYTGLGLGALLFLATRL
ncbi:MAG: UbiA family prenyltransferase [Polyangiaceae bacterium]